MNSLYRKDPSAILDYAFDWKYFTHAGKETDWLEATETVSSFTVTVPTGITLTASNQLDGKVTAWLSGGTVGMTYPVTCQITTSMGRTDQRTIMIKVEDR